MEPLLLALVGCWVIADSIRKAVGRSREYGLWSLRTRASFAWIVFGIGFVLIGAANGPLEQAGLAACGAALLIIITVPCRFPFWNRPGWHTVRNILLAIGGLAAIAYALGFRP